MRFRITAPAGGTAEREVAGSSVRFGRDPACEVAFDAAEFPQVSALHARLDRTATGVILTPLSRSNKTLLNDQDVNSPSSVKSGDRIRLGVTGPTIEILALTASGKSAAAGSAGRQPQPASSKPDEPPEPITALEVLPGAPNTVQAAPEQLALLRGSLSTKKIPIGKGGIIGREPTEVEFFLDHPHVSRHHARIRVDDD